MYADELQIEYIYQCFQDWISLYHLLDVYKRQVYTKFHIGQYIVEYEQKGETRAEYGKAVLKELSKRLTDRLGDGWSYRCV